MDNKDRTNILREAYCMAWSGAQAWVAAGLAAGSTAGGGMGIFSFFILGGRCRLDDSRRAG